MTRLVRSAGKSPSRRARPKSASCTTNECDRTQKLGFSSWILPVTICDMPRYSSEYHQLHAFLKKYLESQVVVDKKIRALDVAVDVLVVMNVC